ncbi:MAG TPA: MarR family transcriptional regulator [Alphaproteobacteria bacterium]|nr:MarR family transcriptional regulator [Alphaproteobacteria bacterium]
MVKRRATLADRRYGGKQSTAPKPNPAARGSGADGHIGYLLRQAQVTVRNRIERALADLGVTHPQFSVLTLVNAYDDLSAADVARLSLLTPQTVNVIVHNLERGGLIERSPDPVHGRILRLALSEAARPLLKRCRGRVNEIEKRMLVGLSAVEERAVRRWLAGLAATFGESAG